MARVVKANDGENEESSKNNIPTIHLDWDPASTPSLVMASQTEGPSSHHSLLTTSVTAETPGLSEAYNNAQEVQSEYEQDVNSTLFGATAKLYTENAQSPETPPSLVLLAGDTEDSAEEHGTPLTNKHMNLLSEGEELSALQKSKNRETFGSGLLTSIRSDTAASGEAGKEEFRDEDCAAEWTQTRSHSSSLGL